jgi:DNA-binding CsgD family transcriptional regulator
MTQRVSSSVFAGRARELDELVTAMDRAAEGQPGVVLVGGEAGIGKSRLLAELAAQAPERAVRVLWGQCAGLEEAAIPLLPVASALSGLPGEGTTADLLAAAGKTSATLVLEPSARLHALVLNRLSGASSSDPVLLALEDIHWADRSTLDLLAALARHLRDEHLLIVATYRNDEVERRADLRRFLAEVATAPSARRIELAGLAPAEMGDQIAGILGASAPAELLDVVVARSEGNPFFAEELVARGAGDALSPTLRDMLLARIAALDPDAQAVVRAAAAGGREVHHRLLATAAGLEEPQLTEALREAVLHQVLVAHDDGFAFRHALLQEVAYGELLPGEREQLHAAFAAALEARPDVAGGTSATVTAEIAHHWLRAGDEPKALAAAVRAGAEAEAVGALAEAAGHDTRALRLWDVVPDAEDVAGVDRATLLARAAHATGWTGDPAHAVELVDAAIELVDAAGDPARTVLLHQRRALYLWQLGRGIEGVRGLEGAVALLPAAPPSAERARALGHLGLFLLLAGDPTRSRENAEQAVAIAQAVGARAEEADALVCLGQDLDSLGDRAGALAHLHRAWSMAVELGDDDILSHAAVGLSDVLRRDGQLAQSTEVALEGARVSRRAGLQVRERLCELNAAEAAYEQGRWDLVERICTDIPARDLTDVTRGFAHHTTGALARARGDLDGAEAHLAAQRDAFGEDATPPEYYEIEDEAELALSRGRPQDASRAARRGLGLEPGDSLRILIMAALGVRAEADVAELARARREDDTAARKAAMAFRDDGRQQVGSAAHPALAATLEAEYARADDDNDPALWDAAARAWEARPAPLQAAYARWRQAEAALARRDRVQATQALMSAHATATKLGALTVGSEVEALARRARIKLSTGEEERTPQEAPDAAAELGLTARELEVLEHIALGQTNRQIADELFISIKTAGVHVSSILSKLGAANRTEAGAIAHRLGLVR